MKEESQEYLLEGLRGAVLQDLLSPVAGFPRDAVCVCACVCVCVCVGAMDSVDKCQKDQRYQATEQEGREKRGEGRGENQRVERLMPELEQPYIRQHHQR